ncbi:trichohyalin-like [Battus philenor]|uniref:trichohyalin-like n=1 Tax=Battus philenor TaxID=42288 RepID=UPI0035D0A8F2
MDLIIFSFFLVGILGFEHDNYYYASTIYPVDNIRRRDTIPLNSNRRRFEDERTINYRRTKDIREDGVDRRFEITEAQLKEVQREIDREARIEADKENFIEAQKEAMFKNSLVNEIRENEIDYAQRENQIREEIQARDYDLRNIDKRENELRLNNYNRRNFRLGQRRRFNR